MQHQGVRGYNTFGHIKNADKVFKNISNIHGEITKRTVRVKLPTYEDEKTLSELKESLCKDYFKRYFENQAKENPVVLPQLIPKEINKIVGTMEHWCSDANEMSNLKGLIIHSFDASMYFDKWFYDKLDKETLCKDLDMKEFPSTPILIVYNPKENVILLIRKLKNKDIKKDIELCGSDMKLFMVLFGSELKQGNVKVISLLMSNMKVDEFTKCKGCEHSIVAVEVLESYELFKAWWEKVVSHYKTQNTGELDKDKAEAFSAKLIGFLAAAQFVDNLPSLTKNPNEQMEHILVMLTPAQKDILYSEDKHLIIKGPYGCGKTIIARKKLHMLSGEPGKNEKDELVYFVCYDPRSALSNEIRSTPNVKVYCNKEGNKLSEIINDINEVERNENFNLIVDEYDSEDLDKREAEKLNGLFAGKFQDSFVLLIPQSMEKNREINKADKKEREEKNMFQLLETMKQVELNLVMRNPVEISNLLWVTQNFLKEEQTIYKQREKETSKNLAMLNESDTKEKFELTKLTGISDLEKKITESGYDIDREVKSQEKRLAFKIGLDEAFALAKTPKGSNADMNKIVNSFTYITSEGTGHLINTYYPKVFELVSDNTQDYSFKKHLTLNFVLRKLNILNSNSNNKHVVLHFNTKTDKIPKWLIFALESFEIGRKITANYEEFKYSENKSILVCNFCSFRGLEHSNITIIIDHDIYSVKHYLVEAMARCTNKLAVTVLEKSESMSTIIEKWEEGLNGEPLIDRWKIQINTGISKKVDYQEDEKLKLITINSSSKKHESMQRKFDQYKVQHHKLDIEQAAEKLIEKW